MIIRSTIEIRDTDRDIDCPKGAFKSLRLLLESDRMGFTLTQTLISKGGPYRWHYKNHLEACYCLSGRGRLTNEETGEQWEIRQGDMYALDQNEAHTFEAYEPVVLLCVFNPPLTGKEVHQKDGSYAQKSS